MHWQPIRLYDSRSQQGVALLTILLLVVAIVIVAGSMLASQRVTIREYAAIQRQGQAEQAALAGEALARGIILQDSLANQVDSLQEIWAKPLPTYPVSGGTIKLRITDEASRFNINNLYHDGKVDTNALAYFRALLQQQGIDPQVAMAILDWQDPDSTTTPGGGAEADYYQSLGRKAPTPIANQPFVHLDELLLVKGMDKQKLDKLRPLIGVVPFFVPMNVNTANPSLLALIPSVTDLPATAPQSPASAPSDSSQPPGAIDTTAIMRWAATRPTAMPIDSVADFWAQPVFAGIAEPQRAKVASLLAVQSRAYRVFVTVTLDGSERFFTSQLAKIGATDSMGNRGTVSEGTASNGAQGTQVVTFNRQFLATAPPFE